MTTIAKCANCCPPTPPPYPLCPGCKNTPAQIQITLSGVTNGIACIYPGACNALNASFLLSPITACNYFIIIPGAMCKFDAQLSAAFRTININGIPTFCVLVTLAVSGTNVVVGEWQLPIGINYDCAALDADIPVLGGSVPPDNGDCDARSATCHATAA